MAVNRFSMGVLALVAAMPFCAVHAVVHTNGIVNGATDWCVPGSYDDGIVPSANDVVVISNGFTVTVADAASMAKVSSLSFLHPEGTGKVIFDVPQGQVWTNAAAFCGMGRVPLGCLYKTGLGGLYLDSFDRDLVINALYDYYCSNITVAAGTLWLRQKSGTREYWYGTFDVARDAVLVVNTKGGTPTGGTCYMHISAITGEGEINGPADNYMPMRIIGTCTFPGKLTGSIQYYGKGRVMLTGTESTSSLTPWVYGGDGELLSAKYVTGIAKIGMSGSSSSISTTDALCVGEKGGGYIYLGAGETTNKGLQINTQGNSDACPAFFDAGAKGKITFTGNWGLRNASPSYAWIEPIVIMGSNTSECVMSNAIRGYVGVDAGGWTAGGTNYAFNIVKRGSGAWRFANNANAFWGGFSVDEGTLRYDTLDETNLVSCLGKGGVFYDDAQTREPWNHKVDYCFRLGNENISGQDKTEGTLEYTGTQGSSAGTRTFALKGHGRLLNNTATRVRYTGFRSVSSGNHVLTLDGSGLNTNEVFNVADGVGTVSVAKTGSGTWALGGDTTFSGSLDVKGGTLLVRPASTNFTWFLWTIRQVPSEQVAQVSKFGLFDAEGRRLNTNLAFNEGDYSSVDPGQVAYRSHCEFYVYNEAQKPDAMFRSTHSNDTFWRSFPRENGSPKTSSPTTPQWWFQILMRLTNETAVADSYDIYLRQGRYPGATNGKCNPKNYTLYGSTDGLNWEALHDVADSTSDDPALNGGMPIPADKGNSTYYWVSTSKAYEPADATCHKGHPIRGYMETARPKPLCNVSSVSASGGGVLKCAAAEKIEVSGLSVDCAAAAGTIDGFRFAASGAISVTNYTKPASGDLELPVMFANADGLANIPKWEVNVNGAPSRLHVLERGGRLHLVRPGMVVTVR